jgi:hypothetical protein
MAERSDATLGHSLFDILRFKAQQADGTDR